MADNSHQMSFRAGQATAQSQEKASGLMDKAKDAAHSAQHSMQQAGQQMKEKTQGAADAVKDKTGINNKT